MEPPPESSSSESAESPNQRLADWLDEQRRRGVKQTDIAETLHVQPQYLSDVKSGLRPLTAAFVRRVETAFGISAEWLLEGGDRGRRPSPSSRAPAGAETPPGVAESEARFRLALLPYPVEGDPRLHPAWDGAEYEPAPAVAAMLRLARRPYVLRFGCNDVEGRIRNGDLLVISQTDSTHAVFVVVRHRRKLVLVRRTPKDGLRRVANGESLPEDSPVCGHAIGIIWGALLEP